MKIKTTRKPSTGQFFFNFVTNDDKVVLKSEAYESRAACDNGKQSVLKNAGNDDRYDRKVSADNRYYFNLKAGNNQIIGTSVMFATEAEREDAIKLLQSLSKKRKAKSATPAAPATTTKTTSETTSKSPAKELDDYKSLGFYVTYGGGGDAGFYSFESSDDNEHYFTFNSHDGQVLLISQGYTNTAGRDNGIASVEKNSKLAERYGKQTTDKGKYFFTIKAGNNQEVARSIEFDDEGERDTAIEYLQAYSTKGKDAAIALVSPPPATSKAAAEPAGKDSTKELDDYRHLGFYVTYGGGGDAGFYSFESSDDNEHYFTFNSHDGQVLLLSQGYTNAAGRDNGIASVEKNSKLEKRYGKQTTDKGKYFFTIKAGNNQEVARSIEFDEEDERDTAIQYLLTYSTKGKGAAMNLVAPPETTSKSAAAPEDGKIYKDYKPLGFYSERITGTEYGYDSFAEGNEHYFTINRDGAPLLLSEDYTTDGGRDKGIKSVKNNVKKEERYVRKVHPNGKHYFNLIAGNKQEIATSIWFDSKKDMEKGITWLQSTGGTRRRKKATREKKPAAERKYIQKGLSYPCSEITYETFQSGGNQKYYFVFKTKEDKAILINGDVRGIATTEDLDKTIAELIALAPHKDNYEIKETKSGKVYFYVVTKEGKKVGRSSLFFKTKEDMDASIALLACGVGAVAAGSVDEYMECSAYAGGDGGFHSFKNEENGEFYFGYNANGGKTYLRSEGYTSASGRDNGINSVTKNAPNDERWKSMEEDGEWFYALRAGNNQEIARSCPYDSEAAMMADYNWVRGENSSIGRGATLVGGMWMSAFAIRRKKEDEEAARLAAEAEAKAKADAAAKAKADEEARLAAEAKAKADAEAKAKADAEAKAKAEKARLAAEAEAKAKAEAEAKAKAEKARLAAEAEAKAKADAEAKAAADAKKKAAAAAAAAALVSAAAAKVTRRPKKVEDDYLPCAAYKGHNITDKENNVALFKKDGQMYFVIYNADGSVRLRSEGFEDAKERDDELSEALGNLNNEESYDMIKKEFKRGTYTMKVIRDKDGREVGRSCLEKEVPAVAAAPIVEDREDDYLGCKSYRDHKINDKENRVAFFKHKNGKFYFAIYNTNGSVRLRSEGFTDAKERDVELSGALKNLDKKEMYKSIERGAYKIKVLYDKTGREVGRTCPKKIVVAAPVAAAAAVTTAAAAPVAAAAAAPVAAAAAGGWGIWKWLPLLLLLLLIPLIMYFCGYCGTATPPPPPPPPVEKAAPAPEPEVQEATPPPPAPVTCNCNSSSDAVFNLSNRPAPKSLSRLGTNPEFGNSHSLNPSQFYAKLKRQYDSSGTDKRFLDRIFKEMGYGGFGDATADLFSNTTIARGTSGNMGYSKAHRTVYATLNVDSDRDLQAFKIEAANGCDLNFMKTCGNHFFYCPN